MQVSLPSFIPRRIPHCSQAEDIKRRNILSRIYRSINLNRSRRFYWLESDETKWRWNRFPFRQICFVLTSIPIRRKYGLSRLLSLLRPRSLVPPLDKCTLFSSSTIVVVTRGGIILMRNKNRGICWAATFFTIVENRREEISKFTIGCNSTSLTNSEESWGSSMFTLTYFFDGDIYILYIYINFVNLKIKLEAFFSSKAANLSQIE